ncbi:MAG: hypothetical protein RMJ66_01500 [Bacteroidia bacterium]|nr:hypothetical protein [Bacteroidia bacterium]MDW8133720.1 hypothetical protein [Bacteroidia bacterium]
MYRALKELASSDDTYHRKYGLSLPDSLVKYFSYHQVLTDYTEAVLKDFVVCLGDGSQDWSSIYPMIDSYLSEVRSKVPFAEGSLLSALWKFGYRTMGEMDRHLLSTCLRYGEMLLGRQPQPLSEKARYIRLGFLQVHGGKG